MSNNVYFWAGIVLSVAANYLVLKTICKGGKRLAFLERLRSPDLKGLQWAIVTSATGVAFFFIWRAGGTGMVGGAAVFCATGLVLYSKALLKISFTAGVVLILCSSIVMSLILNGAMFFPFLLQAIQNS